jgi:hypothetical protein
MNYDLPGQKFISEITCIVVIPGERFEVFLYAASIYRLWVHFVAKRLALLYVQGCTAILHFHQENPENQKDP